jgi:hypothetical protein
MAEGKGKEEVFNRHGDHNLFAATWLPTISHTLPWKPRLRRYSSPIFSCPIWPTDEPPMDISKYFVSSTGRNCPISCSWAAITVSSGLPDQFERVRSCTKENVIHVITRHAQRVVTNLLGVIGTLERVLELADYSPMPLCSSNVMRS